MSTGDDWTQAPGPDGVTVHYRCREHAGRLYVTDVHISGATLTNEMLRAVSVSRIEATINVRHRLADRARLTRPTGKDPDAFYALVAAAYTEYAPQTRAPAKGLAAEAGVPVTTAHRWIREARRRGFLPKARKGRAG